MTDTPGIHPTAVVDARAELDRGVRIGPYSVIGAGARIGRDVEIGAHAVLEGRVTLGARCRVGHGAIIGGEPQDLKFRDGLPVGVAIGDETSIREYVTVHRATHEGHDTRIGERCLVMASSHIAHDCVIGDEVIIINYAGLTGHVIVEDRATVGGHTGLHPFARIGTYAYIGGLSKVTQDVPPFMIADGIPARAMAVNVIGMRRGGVDAEGRRQVRSAFTILYRSRLAPGAAIARVKAELGGHPLVAKLVEFVESSKHGIIAGRRDDPAAREEAESEERVW
jgi:UDP-N-acetylglucosamine acyltransferase